MFHGSSMVEHSPVKRKDASPTLACGASLKFGLRLVGMALASEARISVVRDHEAEPSYAVVV